MRAGTARVALPPGRATPPRAWYAVALLTVAYSLSLLDRTILSLMVGPLQRDLRITDTQFGLLQGFVFAVFFSVAGVPIGRLVDRFPRRLIIGGGIALWSAMTILSGFAARYSQLFAARVGVGVGEATLGPGAYSWLADLFPRDRLAKAVSVYHTGSMIGAGIAFSFGGTLVSLLGRQTDVALPLLGHMRVWQAAFVCAGVPGVLVSLLMLTAHEPGRCSRQVHEEMSVRVLLLFLRSRRRVLCFHWAAFCFFAMNNYAFITWVPTMFIRSDGMTPAGAGTAMGVAAGVFGLVGTIAGGAAADRWQRAGRADAHMRIALLGAIAALPFSLGVGLSGPPAIKIGCLFGLFFSLSFPGGAAYAGLQLITPPRLRGQVSALFLMVITLVGVSLGPLLVGVFTDFVFRSKAAVGLSLASVAILAVPGAIISFALSMRPFARALTSQEAEAVSESAAA